MNEVRKVSVSGLRFAYDKEEILRDVTFEIKDTDFLCITGASGVGKTTLLKLIAGILCEEDGTVYINGINQKDIPSYKRRISFVFQEPNLYPHMTAYQNVSMGIKKRKLDIIEKNRIVNEMLQRFGLARYVNLKPKHLSIGEQQKVALAKCLVSEDDLYLMDEPFCNMDPQSKAKMLEMLKDIQKEKQKPFIVVCHDANDIAKLATKVLVLEDGRMLDMDDTSRNGEEIG